jgi:TetR/AcrR family transcriptional repressor of mexCD-oprJ operon
VAAAERSLPAAQIRAAHDGMLVPVGELLERGRSEGVFRTDLPTSWLAAVLHSVVHCAATEVGAGRVDPGDAASYITKTVLASFAPGLQDLSEGGGSIDEHSTGG